MMAGVLRGLVTAGVVVVFAAGCSGGEPGAAASPATSETTQTGRASEPGPLETGRASEPDPAQTGRATISGPAETGRAGEPRPVETGETCNGTALLTSADGFPEVRGSAEGAELWGLLFAAVPFEVGEEVKIVWRMTGDGPLKVAATGPGGKRAKLVWLEEHGGSSWRRPGHEWGTGWVFPEPGCWKVELTRTRGSGHVWLSVA